MKELIEYLERKIELCTEMNMPLEKFAYTDALKKTRALQLQQTGVIKSVCKHENITRSDGLDECLDCGARNY